MIHVQMQQRITGSPCSGRSHTGCFKPPPHISSRAFHFTPAAPVFSEFQNQFLAVRIALCHWGRDCPLPTEVGMSIVCVVQLLGSPWASEQRPSCPLDTRGSGVCSWWWLGNQQKLTPSCSCGFPAGAVSWSSPSSYFFLLASPCSCNF